MPRPHVALVPHPVLGPRMAGPGWRYWDLARALAPHARVTLLAPEGSEAPEPGGPELVPTPRARAHEVLGDFDAVITQGVFASPLRDGRALGRTRLVLDLYDPLPFELPEHYAAVPGDPGSASRYASNLRRLVFLAGLAEAVLVANRRQADMACGLLIAAGGPALLDPEAATGLGRRVLEVPCGTAAPGPDAPGPDATLDLAWGGGAWTWFQTDLALLVAAELHARDPRYRLRVPAPPPGPEARLAHASDMLGRARAADLVGTAVAVDPWGTRPEFRARLAGCRVGLSLAGDGMEARFAHRTRVLDFLSAELPCVLSRGDALAEEGAREGWAIAVEPGDLEATLDAVRRLAEDGPDRDRALEAVGAARRARTWAVAVEPLVTFLASPPPPPRKPPWGLSMVAHQLRRLPGF